MWRIKTEKELLEEYKSSLNNGPLAGWFADLKPYLGMEIPDHAISLFERVDCAFLIFGKDDNDIIHYGTSRTELYMKGAHVLTGVEKRDLVYEVEIEF